MSETIPKNNVQKNAHNAKTAKALALACCSVLCEGVEGWRGGGRQRFALSVAEAWQGLVGSAQTGIVQTGRPGAVAQPASYSWAMQLPARPCASQQRGHTPLRLLLLCFFSRLHLACTGTRFNVTVVEWVKQLFSNAGKV